MEKDKLRVLQTDHSDGNMTNDYHGNDEKVVCGAGYCHPSFMQRCARIGCFTAMTSLAGLMTSTMSIYLNSQVTTLERQFGLSSSISGMLMSCSELGYLLTILLFSYLARRLHIPRTLAATTMLFGLSGLVCTIPFFASRNSLLAVTQSLKELNVSQSDAFNIYSVPLCADDSVERSLADNFSLTTNMLNGTDTCGAEKSRKKAAVSEDWKGLAVALLAIGMIFQGFSKSPRQVLIGVYIDDNVSKTETTLHLDTGLSPRDPRWIGAWWLGFFVFGIIGIVVALPLVFFPRRLRPQPQVAALKEERKRAANGRKCTYDTKEFLRSVMRVVMTPIYTLVVLGVCSLVLGSSGLVSFLPKYIETQFFVPTWKANVMIGFVNIMAMSLGPLIGGYVTSRFKFPPMKCLKFALILIAVCTCLSVSGIVLGCDQPHLDMGMTSQSVTNTSQRCQSNCQCDNSHYFPTCGADGVTYFSPCHAGCSENRGVFYSNCSCIEMPRNTQPVLEAVPGLCDQKCSTFYPYIAISFCSDLLSTMCLMPCFIILLRSVAEVDKPVAIGVYSFSYTVLASKFDELTRCLPCGVVKSFFAICCLSLFCWFPAAVLFGQVVDTTCLLWSSGCAGRGSCLLYDLRAFRHRIFGMFFTTRVANLIFFVVAFVVASRMKRPFFAHCEAEPEVSTLPTDETAMITKNTTTIKVFNKDEMPSDSLTSTEQV